MDWRNYKNKTYTQHEARKMDYELDIVHGLITELYDKDCNEAPIKETLDKIERVVTPKGDNDE